MRRDANDGGEFVWDWIIPGVEFEIDCIDDATGRVGLIGGAYRMRWLSLLVSTWLGLDCLT